MNAWQKVPLGKLCDVVAGGTPSRTNPAYFGGQVPWVKIGDMLQGEVFSTEETISQAGLANSAAKILPSGTVIISIFATIGRTAVLGLDAATNQAIAGLTPRDTKTLTSEYLRLYLDGVVKELERRGRGVAQANINLAILRSLPIPLPPTTEQVRIVEVLNQAATVRAKRREALAKLDELLRSIFLDFYGEVKEVSSRLPLAGTVEVTRGSFVNGPFGSDLLTSELQEEGVPVIYIRDIRNGEYRRVSAAHVSVEKARTLAVCSVNPGDVLVAKVGDPPGIAAIYPQGAERAVVTQDVIRLRLDAGLALPEFIAHFLNSSIGRLRISEITVSATRARFSLRDFKRLVIDLPPLSLQRKFARQIKAVECSRSSLRTYLAELDALLASLQYRAFRGEL